MALYWTIFFVPLLGAIFLKVISLNLRIILSILFFSSLVIIIGFRKEVGGDWYTYIHLYDDRIVPRVSDILSIIKMNFLYDLLFAFGQQHQLGIQFINTLCAILFVAGIVVFCSQERNYFLAFLISVPYLIIVVGMGYTRQSAALGLILIAISFLKKENLRAFFITIFFAALFHKSSLVVAPFGMLAMETRKITSSFIVPILLVIAMIGLSADALASMFSTYISDDIRKSQHASGGLIRIILCVIPALLVLRYSKVLFPSKVLRRFWLRFSILPILALFLVFYASNLADRLALYSIPLQITVFSRIELIFKDPLFKDIAYIGVSFVYFCLFYLWLNFSFNSQSWVPYDNFLF